jgi:predicted transposase YbfD/YdcC
MTTLANEATSQQKDKTFADVVNEIVNTAEVDAKGNIILPDDLDEQTKFAATTEKRRRDTQASFHKLNRTNKALEVEKANLMSKVAGSVTVNLTAERKEELDNLKFEDPEAWRKEMNKLENSARTERLKEIETELSQVSKSTLDTEELESRKTTLFNFQEANPDIEINDDVISSDIPPRIVKKLETGAITFEAFLNECATYLKTGKVVTQEETLKQPNLGKIAGSATPDKNAIKEDAVLSYNKETF